MNRAERRAAAREGILAAAHRQVAEGGFASASVAAVAARAGVASGSLYRHFASRSELLAEVVDGALRAELALLGRATDGLAPREGLAAWVSTSVERTLRAPALAHALLAEPADATIDAARLEARRVQEAQLGALLAGGAHAGDWPRGDAAMQAAAIAGALQAALVGPGAAGRLGPHPDPVAEAELLVGFVLAAVGARG